MGVGLAVVWLLGVVDLRLSLVFSPVLRESSSGGDESSDGKESELHNDGLNECGWIGSGEIRG